MDIMEMDINTKDSPFDLFITETRKKMYMIKDEVSYEEAYCEAVKLWQLMTPGQKAPYIDMHLEKKRRKLEAVSESEAAPKDANVSKTDDPNDAIFWHGWKAPERNTSESVVGNCDSNDSMFLEDLETPEPDILAEAENNNILTHETPQPPMSFLKFKNCPPPQQPRQDKSRTENIDKRQQKYVIPFRRNSQTAAPSARPAKNLEYNPIIAQNPANKGPKYARVDSNFRKDENANDTRKNQLSRRDNTNWRNVSDHLTDPTVGVEHCDRNLTDKYRNEADVKPLDENWWNKSEKVADLQPSYGYLSNKPDKVADLQSSYGYLSNKADKVDDLQGNKDKRNSAKSPVQSNDDITANTKVAAIVEHQNIVQKPTSSSIFYNENNNNESHERLWTAATTDAPLRRPKSFMIVDKEQPNKNQTKFSYAVKNFCGETNVLFTNLFMSKNENPSTSSPAEKCIAVRKIEENAAKIPNPNLLATGSPTSSLESDTTEQGSSLLRKNKAQQRLSKIRKRYNEDISRSMSD